MVRPPKDINDDVDEQAGDFLIGADGINSVVRKSLFLTVVCHWVCRKID